MSIKTKLIIVFILLVSVPALIAMAVSTWVAGRNAQALLVEQSRQQLVSVRESKKREIESVLKTMREQIRTFSANTMVVNAASEFNFSFPDFLSEAGWKGNTTLTDRLRDFYQHQFGQRFTEKNPNSNANPLSFIDNLDNNSVGLQYAYIANNEHPLGEKHQLIENKDDSFYSLTHGRFHPAFKQYLEAFGYYDIFLVHPVTGRIVYSVYKEIDFATSLKDGVFAETGIGEAFRAAVESNQPDFVYMTDFAPYAPSYGHPAAFLSSPVFQAGVMSGVLIFQIPQDRIVEIMTSNHAWESVGLGKTGQSYLVGSDKTLRSENRHFIEHSSDYLDSLQRLGLSPAKLADIRAKKTAVGLQPVDTACITQALNGESGFAAFTDFRNIEVISTYAPLSVEDQQWVIISEMDMAEVNQHASALSQALVKMAIMLLPLMAAVAIACGVGVAFRLVNPVERLEQEIGEIEKNSDLSFQLQAKPNDVTVGIVSSLNVLLSKIHSIVTMAADGAQKITHAAENIESVSVETNEGVSKQSAEIERVASAMDEMVASVKEVSQSAGNTSRSTYDVNQQAEQSNQLVQNTTLSIERLANEVQQATDVINQLAVESDKISGVMDVIESIAEQTNLLALNAAIEAARAGEQGRGFAVVADEVRLLASRTQESTSEIQQMIVALQNGSEKAVKVMGKGQATALASVEEATQAAEALRQIKSAVQEITQMSQHIAQASEQQSLASADVNSSLHTINDVSDATTAEAVKMQEASSELTALAAELKQAISQFKL
ncbi:MAG TPA: hypothetical protein DCZ12_06130 [Gammaproteobacteria bacterium]|nr:hypothetical protein [Gammaproteobacteria bacterium]